MAQISKSECYELIKRLFTPKLSSGFKVSFLHGFLVESTGRSFFRVKANEMPHVLQFGHHDAFQKGKQIFEFFVIWVVIPTLYVYSIVMLKLIIFLNIVDDEHLGDVTP